MMDGRRENAPMLDAKAGMKQGRRLRLRSLVSCATEGARGNPPRAASISSLTSRRSRDCSSQQLLRDIASGDPPRGHTPLDLSPDIKRGVRVGLFTTSGSAQQTNACFRLVSAGWLPSAFFVLSQKP
jgi:hypothetical protein